MSRRILADTKNPGLTIPIHSTVDSVHTSIAKGELTSALPINDEHDEHDDDAEDDERFRPDTPSHSSYRRPSARTLTTTSTTTTTNNLNSNSSAAVAGPSSSEYAEVRLAPATRTSVVTTTTTTTVHFAPILIPKSKPIKAVHSSFSGPPAHPSRRSTFSNLFDQIDDCETSLDPKLYPLSQTKYPAGLKRFNFELGGLKAVFHQDHPSASDSNEVIGLRPTSGKGKERLGSYLNKGSERGPLHQRRVSRRSSRTLSGPSFAAVGNDVDPLLTTEQDVIEEERERERSHIEADEDDERMNIDGPDLGPPPRKRARAASLQASIDVDLNANAAGMNLTSMRRESLSGNLVPGSLPSPNLSPPSPVPTFAGEDCKEDEEEEEGQEHRESPTQAIRNAVEGSTPEDQFDLGSGLPLSGLLSLPDYVKSFDQLPPSLQSYFIYTFLKRAPVPVLQTINNLIAPALRRDFLTDLPPELSVQILCYLDTRALCRASVVCKGWRRLVDGESKVWKERLIKDGLWIGDGSEEAEAKTIGKRSDENLFLKRWRAGVWEEHPDWTDDDVKMTHDASKTRRSIPDVSASTLSRRTSQVTTAARLASPSSSRENSPFNTSEAHYVHPFKPLYQRRFENHDGWMNRTPKRTTFACNANNVVTCLQFDKERIVSASDDHAINVWDTRTGEPKARLQGHEGGVWALQYIGNVLVSGSTDRTVRVWDLEKNRCTHTFVGHTSTVRCLQIVEPENVNPDPNGAPIWEPAFPLIVTGSRDWSLRVWKLPLPGKDVEYHPVVPQSPTEENTAPSDNPYHLRHLQGHRHAVRALAAHGRTLVSGSYDCQVRVWDIITGQCRHRLTGHTQKVYSVVYDHVRAQCASGSMDGNVRLWSTTTGDCIATLDGHTSLVGLLGLSFRHLVSAAADSTLRVWDPVTGACRHVLAAHSGAITCFQHDEYKVISGSDGTLKMWDVRNGLFSRDLLTGLSGVWQVAFDRRFCVAAIQRGDMSEFEVLDFFPEENELEVGERVGGKGRGQRRGSRRTSNRHIDELILVSDGNQDNDDDDDDDDDEDGDEDDDDDALIVIQDQRGETTSLSLEGTGGFSAQRGARRDSEIQALAASARRMSPSTVAAASTSALTGLGDFTTPQNVRADTSTATASSPTSSRRQPPPTRLRAEEFPRRLSGGPVSWRPPNQAEQARARGVVGGISSGPTLRRVVSGIQSVSQPGSSTRRTSSQNVALEEEVEEERRMEIEGADAQD